MRPLEARRGSRRLKTGAGTVTDDLTWLRGRDDPRVLEFLRAENERTRRETAHLADLEDRLYREFRSRIQEADRSVPARRGRFFYASRTEEGKPYRVWVRSTEPDGEEEVLLDENRMAEGHDYFHVGRRTVSPDHRFLAYTRDVSGDEDYELVIVDLETGERLDGGVDLVSADIAWSSDSRTLFYVRRDRLKRPHRVFRHTLGFDPSEDALVFEEPDAAFHVSLRRALSGRFLFIESTSAITVAARLVDAARPDGEPVPLCPVRPGVEHHLVDGGDALFVRTNDGAKNFRLARVPLGPDLTPLDPSTWTDEVPHREHVLLEKVEAFRDFLVLTERREGLRELIVRRRPDGAEQMVPLEGDVRTVEAGENLEFETDEYRFVLQTPVTPPTTSAFDPRSGEQRVLKVEPVPGFEPKRYRTERVWAPAEDGTEIPISIVAPADIELDGNHPCLLNGYGAYGVCNEPVFSRPTLSLVDRGVVFAIAHVRGGGELGEAWHDGGKMLNKRNTFTDFISCAEALIGLGYTAPDRLGIQGRSAGGLLVGAVTNMRPDLFRCVVAGVPFVDVLATMLDSSIPLTVIEYEEWGDPRDPDYYDYIRSYSPFDNVRETEYPHMLVTAGLHDPRVQYWEPARWVARLRQRRTDDRLLLLRTDMDAGHLGPSSRFDWLRERAFEHAFVLATLGADDPGPGSE